MFKGCIVVKYFVGNGVLQPATSARSKQQLIDMTKLACIDLLITEKALILAKKESRASMSMTENRKRMKHLVMMEKRKKLGETEADRETDVDKWKDKRTVMTEFRPVDGQKLHNNGATLSCRRSTSQNKSDRPEMVGCTPG